MKKTRFAHLIAGLAGAVLPLSAVSCGESPYFAVVDISRPALIEKCT